MAISNLRRLVFFPAVCALSVAFFGCGDDETIGTTTLTPGTTSGGTQQGRTVEVSAKEFTFTPAQITATPGERLIIVLTNDGSDTHSIEFELPGGDVGIDGTVAPGATDRVTIDAPATQSDYEYYCPVSGHRQLGMVGTLTVEETPTTP